MSKLKTKQLRHIKESVLLILTCSTLGASCVKTCHHVKGLSSAGMTVTMFHAFNNEYFYPQDEWRSPFRKDSLMISDSQGFTLRQSFSLKSEPINPLNAYYVVGFAPIFDIQLDKDAFNVESTKFIYIKYSYNTSDTLKMVFKTKKTKCADAYEYLKVYHRNHLIASISDDTGIVFTLKH
jgi:hypothetical protein